MDIHDFLMAVVVIAIVSIMTTSAVYSVFIDTAERDRLIDELRESCKAQSFYELNFKRCFQTGVRP